MKISNISIRRENLELVRPYTIAYKTVSSVENLFVQVHLENGMIGWGATNPSKYVVGEDLEDTARVLTEEALSPFIGRDIREFYSLLKEMHTHFAPHVGVRIALDIAFHDAFTQYLGVPLVKFLGQAHTQFATSITIGIKSIEEALNEAEEYIGRGFQILKVKLGNDLGEDLERLHKIRERWPNIGIRVDANQGYGVEEVLKFYEKTRSLRLELVEQPLPADQIEAIRALPEEVQKEIAADESLVSPQDAWQLATPTPACGIFNIKLMKCGGIFQGQQIAEIARHVGIHLMWGCNDESIVSISAALHLALASPQTRYIDLDGSLDLARDLVGGGFVLENGVMRVTDRPGLGLQALS
ncbi:MAG: dipeptide epimerase [Bacteroidota bacterium]